jgi:type II secretory ATPase GspE/PulE/Tfp pilus assembly ATPase PilB-like protein
MAAEFSFDALRDEVRPLEQQGEDGVPGLLDTLIQGALQARASDLHLECHKQGIRIKYRIDGVLRPVVSLSKTLQTNLIARLKIMSRVMSFKKREPQDGRIEVEFNGQTLTLRSAFLPTLHGESVTLRLPDESKRAFEIETLGLSPALEEQLLRVISAPQGTLLLTGPSSSGKTTTIYAVLKRLVHTHGDRVNILTIEDPIEAEIDGVSQTQLDPAGGLTYASGLRAILRQDPNVIVVGEIRDEETAHIAIQAGLTGHLVISTVHSGRATGVFTRLLNMGIEPFLIASSVSGVIAQRLVRRICEACKEQHEPAAHELESIGITKGDSLSLFKGKGCERCNGTGYLGRIGIFEFLLVTEPLKECILRKAPTQVIHDMATRSGMKMLHDDLRKKICSGLTTLEEATSLALTE